MEQLKAYWAKAITALIWPDSWNGLHHFPIPPYFPLEGDILTPNPSSLTPRVFINNSTGTPIITNATYNSGTSSITIPVIQSNYDAIIEFPGFPPDPSQYPFNPQPWHFVWFHVLQTSPNPPYGMYYPEGTDINANTLNNNKIVWKNVEVVDGGNTAISVQTGSLMIQNITNNTTITKFKFDNPVIDDGNPYINYGSIKINLGHTLFQKWNNGGNVGSGLEICSDSVIHIFSPHAWIEI